MAKRTFSVRCIGTQDNEPVEAFTPEDAVMVYLDGYVTMDKDDDPWPEGQRYSTLEVWWNNDCVMTHDVVADGKGGVQ